MVKGFIAGSLGLIILYAVLLKGSTDRITEGGNAVNAGMRRFLEPGVAGVGNHAKGTAPAGGGSGSGGGVPVAGGTGGRFVPVGYQPPTTLRI